MEFEELWKRIMESTNEEPKVECPIKESLETMVKNEEVSIIRALTKTLGELDLTNIRKDPRTYANAMCSIIRSGQELARLEFLDDVLLYKGMVDDTELIEWTKHGVLGFGSC